MIATQIRGNPPQQTNPPPPPSLYLSPELPQTARRVRALQNVNSREDVEEISRPCIPRDYGRGSFVCVCNSSYCDTVSLTIPTKISNLYPSSYTRTNSKFLSKIPKTVSLSKTADFGGVGDSLLPQQSFDDEIEGGGGVIEEAVGPSDTAPPPDFRGQVQIFTSTKTGSRLHKSIVQFNNYPDQPYRREHLLSPYDDLMERRASRSADPSTTTSRSQKLITFGDNPRVATSVGKIFSDNFNAANI